MPASEFQEYREFREFEAYIASVRDAEVRFTLPKLEEPIWQIRHTFLDGLHLQYAYEGGGNIAEGGVDPSGCLVFVPLSQIEVRANGGVMNRGDVFIGAPRSDFRLSCEEPHEWFSLFVPSEFLSEGSDQSLPGLPKNASATMLHAGQPLVDKLRDRASGLNRSSAEDARVMDHIASRVDLRDRFVATIREILGCPPPASTVTAGRPAVERDIIIRSALSVLDPTSDVAPSVDRLAQAADVSERTLRTVFGEVYGVPPARYIRLRRLHETRKALRQLGPEESSVTEIAARFGFWDFGRFAKEYRQVFGELPSETLRKDGKPVGRPVRARPG